MLPILRVLQPPLPPRWRGLALALTAFSALSALGGGIALVFEPQGNPMLPPIELLEPTPFESFLVPGLLLTFVVGGTSLWALGMLWRRARLARFATAFSGATLAVWIGVEVLLIREMHWLHFVYGGLGLAMLVVPLLAPRRRPCEASSPGSEVRTPADSERSRIEAFLSLQRIALVGASSEAAHFSRMVMRELLGRGIDVVPIHPSAETVEGRRAFAGLEQLDAPVQGVLVMTPQDASASVVAQCAAAGVRRVWLHRGAGPGSVSDEALRVAADHDLVVVAGRCPLMFLGEHPALVHRLHAGMLKLSGRYPR